MSINELFSAWINLFDVVRASVCPYEQQKRVTTKGLCPRKAITRYYATWGLVGLLNSLEILIHAHAQTKAQA